MLIYLHAGNAQTSLLPPPHGLLQGDGRRVPEATFDPKHVGEAIAHIASLPLDVTVLTFNIMYVLHRRTEDYEECITYTGSPLTGPQGCRS